MAETLFGLLNDLIKDKAGNGPVTIYHYVSAYSSLLSMQSEIIFSLLPDRKEQKEFIRLQETVSDLGLDINNMRQYSSLLLNSVPDPYDLDVAIAYARENSGGDADYISADVLFRKLVADNSFIQELFRPGVSINDITKFRHAHEALPSKPVPKPAKTPVERPDFTINPGLFLHTKEESEDHSYELSALETPKTFPELTSTCVQLYDVLRQYVIGQDEAVRIFVQSFFQSELCLEGKTKKGPKAMFLFAGPPGVGKTFLATTAAEQLQLPYKRFDMSEYANDGDLKELIGYDANYKSPKPGLLTDFVHSNPHCVIIFDEFEKAHRTVMHTFLQILDAGTVRDQNTQESVSFTSCTLIFTTNVGKKLYKESTENLSMLSQQVVLKAISEETNPRTNETLIPEALVSRFASGNVVMFNNLRGRYLMEIARRNFESQAAAFRDQYHCDLTIDSLIVPLFLFHMSSNLDARIISSQSRILIGRELYEFARLGSGKNALDHLSSIVLKARLPENDPEIRSLFIKDHIDEILLLCNSNATKIFDRLPVQITSAASADELCALAEEQDYNLILIDPLFGNAEYSTATLGMEDYDTEGIRAFHQIISSSSDYPLYILDSSGDMSDADRATFYQMGARGILTLGSREQAAFCADLDEALSDLYLQDQLSGLSSRGRVLNYNTAQSCTDDGNTGIIEFYDFKIGTAVDADSKDTVMSDADRPDVRFHDIIGAENAKQELDYFIRYLKHPKEYMRKGMKPAKGILLYGPPGTGKTMLAKAMAGEAGVTFLPFAATDFMSKWVGEGENRIRDAFTIAKKYAPSVIFIDEIDAIAKERNSGHENHTETLLNALLTEMDGFTFDPKHPVFILAATNFPLNKESSNGGAIIDPALLRRFDNKICVDLPKKEERLEFLRRKLKDYTIEESVLKNLADRTTGESLSNLNNIVALAVRNAEKAGKSLDNTMLLNALEEYLYGEEHTWTQDYYTSVAHHEAGHAYICWLSGEKPSFLTIVSRGNFGGYMQHENNEASPSYTKEQLLWKIRTALAGRASEIVFFGEESGTNTGVSSDLQQATNIALSMLCNYGMSGTSLLSLSIDTMLKLPSGSELLKQAEALLQREMEYTLRLVRDGKEKVERLSQALLDKNQLVTEEILEILSK